MAVLAEFSIVVVNAWFVPTSSESAGAGKIAMLAGTGKLVVVTALPLLQPGRLARSKTAVLPRIANLTAADLPIHPPRAHGYREASIAVGEFPV
jgi:hypothetical protein